MHCGAPAQLAHAPPSLPHWESAVPGAQLLETVQQPPQETESQTQLPPTQCWPDAHCERPPHLQVPPAQLSARIGSQAKQAAPLAPQVASALGVQLEPEQQPLGQEVAVHP